MFPHRRGNEEETGAHLLTESGGRVCGVLRLCGRVQRRSWGRCSAIAMAEQWQSRQGARGTGLLVTHGLLQPHSARKAAMAQIWWAQDVVLGVTTVIPEHHHIRRRHGRLAEVLQLLVSAAREHHMLSRWVD